MRGRPDPEAAGSDYLAEVTEACCPAGCHLLAATGLAPGVEVGGDHNPDRLHPAWHFTNRVEAAVGDGVILC